MCIINMCLGNSKIAHRNEKTLMELNSLLDNAQQHCNEEYIQTPPTEQLPRPQKNYIFSFVMKAGGFALYGLVSVLTYFHFPSLEDKS